MGGFSVWYGRLYVWTVLVVTTYGYATNADRVIDMTPIVIRVVTGTTALLPCRVDPKYTEKYADQYKVVWVNPSKTAISIQDRRIINDQRISVERPYLKDWNLHIRNVSLTDAGVYKCQINTNPVGTKNITLIVQDPPRIIDHTMPLEVLSEEKGKVELFCNATGFPDPNITWYRLHKNTNGVQERVGDIGNSLAIRNISRLCADSYQCVANNGVEPAISQTFEVSVLYPPEVTLHNSRMAQRVGKDTILDCEVTASPLAVVVWKYRNRTLTSSPRHEVTLYTSDPDRSVVLSLRIRKVKPGDFGTYECEANNKLGYKREYMQLYELKRKTTTTTTTTTTATYAWRSETKHQNMDIYTSGSKGGSNRGDRKGLIWDRQENEHGSQYSSRDDALRSDIGDNQKTNSRETNGVYGMHTRTGSRDNSIEGGSNAANSLILSNVLLASGMLVCLSTAFIQAVDHALPR